MIARLRRRLTLLVIAVLVLVTGGIILAINTVNYRNIDNSAYAALETLAGNRGQRPGLPGAGFGERPDDVEFGSVAPPDSDSAPSDNPLGETGERALIGRRGPVGGWRGDGDLASLSNSYTITLCEDGSVDSWSSDRADLYDDAQIEALAAAALASGRERGRVGTQYFRLAEFSGSRTLIVLDARLERGAAQRVLKTTALVAALACAILSAGATLLIRRMTVPVEASFERQKQFAWDASHELKTPLAVISANAELLAGDIGDNEYLGYIRSEVQRSDRLVQSLLTLARMDKGTVTAQVKRFDMSKALLSVALPFESTVFEAGKTLEMDVPDGVFIRGDEEMLKQLAVILLSNALKYSDAGGTIRLSLSQKGRGCQFSVSNTGPGIARENLEKIFDRFYREDTSHSGEIAGNGLGLAIARGIVEAHKGRIHAESEPGRSATFIVTLP